jgi:hypothetical protein
MHAEIPRPWPVHMQARGGEVDVVPAQRHDSHAAAVKPANDGHDTRAIQAYLGHRSIMSTVRSTALTPNRSLLWQLSDLEKRDGTLCRAMERAPQEADDRQPKCMPTSAIVRSPLGCPHGPPSATTVGCSCHRSTPASMRQRQTFGRSDPDCGRGGVLMQAQLER